MGAPELYYEKISPENKIPFSVDLRKIPDTVVTFMCASGPVRKNSDRAEYIEFENFYIGTKVEMERSREEVQKVDILKYAE